MFTENDLCTTFVGFKENIWKNKIWKSEKKWVTLDFIFLIDASKDLSMDEYKQMKISVGEFFDEIVPSAAESSIRFSVIQYGFDVEIVAPLKVRTPEVIIWKLCYVLESKSDGYF